MAGGWEDEDWEQVLPPEFDEGLAGPEYWLAIKLLQPWRELPEHYGLRGGDADSIS